MMRPRFRAVIIYKMFIAVVASLLAMQFSGVGTLARSPEQSSDQRSGEDTKPAAGAEGNPVKPSVPAAGTRVQGNSGPKILLESNLVNVLVTVTDSYGKVVTGLKSDNFQVYDDKVGQKIAEFSNEDAPISIGIVYDVSGSMRGRINRSISALTRFFETSHRDDDVFLMAFNSRPILVQDFTTSPESVLSHLTLVDASQSTALFDAVYVAVEKIKQGRHARKALLVISDGQDNHSRYGYRELRDQLKEADVLIYAIGVTEPFTDMPADYGRGVLEAIAEMTGGAPSFLIFITKTS